MLLGEMPQAAFDKLLISWREANALFESGPNADHQLHQPFGNVDQPTTVRGSESSRALWLERR